MHERHEINKKYFKRIVCNELNCCVWVCAIAFNAIRIKWKYSLHTAHITEGPANLLKILCCFVQLISMNILLWWYTMGTPPMRTSGANVQHCGEKIKQKSRSIDNKL